MRHNPQCGAPAWCPHAVARCKIDRSGKHESLFSQLPSAAFDNAVVGSFCRTTKGNPHRSVEKRGPHNWRNIQTTLKMLNGTTIFFWMGIVSKFNGYRIPWRSPHGETLWSLNLTQQKCIWIRGDWNGALRIVWDAGCPERCRPEFIDHYKLKNLFYFGGILSYNPNNFSLITHGFRKITSGFTVMLSFSITIHFRIRASSLSGTPLTLCGGTRVNTTLLWMENRPHWPECRQCFPLRMGP